MYKFPFLDFPQLNDSMNSLNLRSNEKIRFIHNALQGTFHDPEQDIISGSAVAIVSIGGLPINISNDKFFINDSEFTIESIQEQLLQTVGMSSFMSYLNPKNKPLNDIAQTTLDLHHNSVLHTVTFSILISGISIGVEHELSSQRDIIHLSRLTVAKTKSQDSPCLVLKDPTHLLAYKETLAFIKKLSTSINDSETRNLLFPTAKASSIMITGSFKNLLKLVSLKNAGGKEDEFVELLIKLEKLLSTFQKFNI